MVAAPRSVVRRVLVPVVVSSFVTVGVLEVVARLVYEAPWYERLLAEQDRSGQHDYRHNSLGLRDCEYDATKPDRTRRVLLLGDSFTHGSGVFDDDAIFPAILERRLSSEPGLPGVERVELLNGGIHGSLTNQWRDLFDQVRESFQPDVVVAVFFLRDGTSTASVPGFFDPIRHEIAERNRASKLYRSSALFRLVRDAIDRGAISDAYATAIRDGYFGTDDQRVEWRRARGNLIYLRDRVREAGGAFAVVAFPILVGFDGDYPFQDVEDAVVEFARKQQIPILDLLPAFRGESAPDLWVSPLDQHPNARGHEIAARAIEPFLREQLLEHESRRGG